MVQLQELIQQCVPWAHPGQLIFLNMKSWSLPDARLFTQVWLKKEP